MADVTITIRAAADPSLRTAFRPLGEGMKQARAEMARETKAMEADSIASARRVAEGSLQGLAKQRDARGRFLGQQKQEVQKSLADELAAVDSAMARERQSRSRANADMLRDTERRAKAEADVEKRERKRATDAALRDFDERLRASKKARDAEEKDIIRTADRAGRTEARAAQEAVHTRRQMAMNIARDTMRGVVTTGRYAVGIGRDVASGMGVDTSIGGLIGRGMDTEGAAMRATMSGFAAKGQRATGADVQSTLGAVRSVGDQTGLKYGEIAQGLETFVAKSSDLEGGKKQLLELAKIAQATGSNFVELSDLAGQAWKTIQGDATIEDKEGAMLDTMRLLATQGAKGSLEIKEMGQYGGRLTAGASKFEGDRATNIGALGAIAQMSMSGGASTAAEATNSAAAFSRDITKGRALKNFEDADINVFADREHKKLKAPEEIIVQTLHKTGGAIDKLSALFTNDVSKRGVQGFATIYNEAGGGAEGEAAVRAKFKELGTAMSQEDVDAAAKLAQEGRAARAAKFQNQLETIADSFATNLVPALEKAAPAVAKLAEVVSGWVVWAANNPLEAVVLALAASAGKAYITQKIGDALTGAIARMIPGGGAPGAGGVAPVGGVAPGGRRGAGVMEHAAAGFALYEIGKYATNEISGDVEKWGGATDAADKEQGRGNELDARIRAVKSGDVEYLKKLRTSKMLQLGGEDTDEGRAAAGKHLEAMGFENPFANLDRDIESAQSFRTANAVNQRPGLVDAMGGAIDMPKQQPPKPVTADEIGGAVAQNLQGSVLQVNVQNMPAAGFGPAVDPGGRTPDVVQ